MKDEHTEGDLDLMVHKDDTSSLEEENAKLKMELETHKRKVSEMQLKIDCQKFELAKLNKKITENEKRNGKSNNDKLLAGIVDHKLLEEYKIKVPELEKKITFDNVGDSTKFNLDWTFVFLKISRS